MHIILYGPEGSGKGTQAKLLSTALGVPIFTSGDLVREAAAVDHTQVGDVCRDALERGGYVPDAEMYTLWKRRLSLPDATGSWIMDGFPRNQDQAQFLDGMFTIDVVVYLKLSEEESIARLVKRARPLHPGSTELHDSPERIKRRLEVYHQSEIPLLSYYKQQQRLHEINAHQSVDAVHKDIMSVVGHE